jgi:hypothetical protein
MREDLKEKATEQEAKIKVALLCISLSNNCYLGLTLGVCR